MFSSSHVVFSIRDVEMSLVLERFAEAMRVAPLSAEDVLASLYNDFAILIERAPGLYSFSHLTLQEYLTAQYIVDNRRELELLKHTGIDEWTEVIRLAAKLLPNANIFMAKLTEQSDVNDYGQVMLLQAVWIMRPLCDRHQTITSMRLLAERATQALSAFGGAYRIDGDTVYIKLSKSQSRANRQIFKNLDAIVSILSVSGVPFRDLRVAGGSPFVDLLGNDKFRHVVIE